MHGFRFLSEVSGNCCTSEFVLLYFWFLFLLVSTLVDILFFLVCFKINFQFRRNIGKINNKHCKLDVVFCFFRKKEISWIFLYLSVAPRIRFQEFFLPVVDSYFNYKFYYRALKSVSFKTNVTFSSIAPAKSLCYDIMRSEAEFC